jgi:hypothetical protein
MRMIPRPASVLAAFLRHPLRLSDGLTLYVLVTGRGRFFSVAAPELFDVYGTPIILTAEIGAGSIVRAAVAGGLMRAVQIAQAHSFCPFSGEPT